MISTIDGRVARAFLNPIVCAAALVVLTGCDFETDDNYDEVPPQGMFIAVETNQHDGGDTIQVAAALFVDGKPVNAVGGNVFKATHGSSEALLRDPGPRDGIYATTLPAEDLSQGVVVSIVHEPLEARDRRWYPIDLINVDPGPAELVGPVATAFFPPEVVMQGPQEGSTYTDLQDEVLINWLPAMAGDTMDLRTAISCRDGLAVNTYGTEHLLGNDDIGEFKMKIEDFIYDVEDENPGISFIQDELLAMMQELLNQLSNGQIDPDYFARRANVNPATARCEITLYLFRGRDGDIDPLFDADNGIVRGERSSEVTIIYQSPEYVAP